MLISTYAYSTVHTYIGVTKLSIPTYITLIICSSNIKDENNKYKYIGNNTSTSPYPHPGIICYIFDLLSPQDFPVNGSLL